MTMVHSSPRGQNLSPPAASSMLFLPSLLSKIIIATSITSWAVDSHGKVTHAYA